MKKRLQVGVVLVALLSSFTALGSTALAAEPSEINVETPSDVLLDTEMSRDVQSEMEPQLVDEVHIVAYDGDADLNAICACLMFGFGSVCGLLAGSEVVRKWML